MMSRELSSNKHFFLSDKGTDAVFQWNFFFLLLSEKKNQQLLKCGADRIIHQLLPPSKDVIRKLSVK